MIASFSYRKKNGDCVNAFNTHVDARLKQYRKLQRNKYVKINKGSDIDTFIMLCDSAKK